MRSFRALCGAVIWVLIVLGLCTAWSTEESAAKPQDVASDVWTYYAGEYPRAELVLPQDVDLAVGDPIFLVETIDGRQHIRRIGEVQQLQDQGVPVARGYVSSAQAMFYPDAPRLDGSYQMEYASADQSLLGAFELLVPPEKRRIIARLITNAYQEHNQAIAAQMWPIVQGYLKESMLTLETELSLAFARHREELKALGARYQQELIAEDVIPLVREEVWPIVRARAEPTANEIGREIWDRLSIWRFGWRMVYDHTPLLPDRNLTSKEWNRFVDAEVVPILEQHTNDLVKVTQGVLRDVSKNERVRDALRKSLTMMLDDPELQRILGDILREVAIDRSSLREIFQKHWTSPEAQMALRSVSHRLEPTAREIGELLIGTREVISPEFALVLRNYALAKDRRWICVFAPSAQTSPAPAAGAPAGDDMPLPPRKTAAGAVLPQLRVRLSQHPGVNPFTTLVNRPGLE